MLISVAFNPEDLKDGVGRRCFVHGHFRFNFMKRLVAEPQVGLYSNCRANLKTILMEGRFLDADQPSFAMERIPFNFSGLAAHQKPRGLGTDFHRHETADVIRLLQGPVLRGGRFRDCRPVIRRQQAVDQTHTVAVGDQFVKGIFSERHSGNLTRGVDPVPPLAAISDDNAFSTTDAAWL